MSRDICFYRIVPIKEELPPVIDLEEKETVYSYAGADSAEEWQKKVGIKRKIRYQTVDLFKTAEKKFGKKPVSMTFLMNGDYRCMAAGEKELGIITEEELKKEYYWVEEDSYIWDQKEIGELEDPYFLSDQSPCIASSETIGKILNEYLQYIEDQEGYVSESCGRDLYVLLKAKREIEKGKTVVMDIG